eukprot:CAMPEP_0119111774 /NCGR_PEP_ID=MMETSP1180-20130426/37265_1 /TAXON_ID=3052 ORGANISM="Chlamydomonas cf sp, Strain CCMP681" /NCGR_SAMPLE_ID=MMETSP1180 /ASSEMBLY_ACC=CAM_ASM_000741 /LENGTH=54 /DNA_ID=CAMNT_0007098951 /DNA_START=178 /DNA_END=342 /DNA_ORIENTATION=+
MADARRVVCSQGVTRLVSVHMTTEDHTIAHQHLMQLTSSTLQMPSVACERGQPL